MFTAPSTLDTQRFVDDDRLQARRQAAASFVAAAAAAAPGSSTLVPSGDDSRRETSSQDRLREASCIPSPGLITATTTTSTTSSEAKLFKRFCDYSSERVTYNEPGTPDQAISFSGLGFFFEDADVMVSLSPQQQAELIDEIRPPSGRLVTWTDFKTILQIVADYRFPDLPEDAGYECVVEDALDRLQRIDDAATMMSIGSKTTTAAAMPKNTKLRGNIAATKDGTAVNTQSKTRQQQVSTQSSSCNSYVPHGLEKLVASLQAEVRGQHQRLLCANGDDDEVGGAAVASSSSSLVTNLTASFAARVLHASPLPMKLKGGVIYFAAVTDVQQQLSAAWKPFIENALGLGGGGDRNVNLSMDVLWSTVQAIGAILFSTSPLVAQEELALQVILNSMHASS